MRKVLNEEANDGQIEDLNATSEIEESEEVTEESRSLEQQLDEAIAERDSYLDQLQRSVAEFANYRKRVEQDRVQSRAIGTRDMLATLVPIADDFKRALASVPNDEADASWIQGVTMIERKLEAVLEREGVRPIDAMGQPFDPSIHEAVAVVPDSSGTTVVEVFQTGYMHGNNLLRPAIVQVGDAPAAEANEQSEPAPSVRKT